MLTPLKNKKKSAGRKSLKKDDTRHHIRRGVRRQNGGSKCAAALVASPLPATASSQLATSTDDDCISRRQPLTRVLQEERVLDIHTEVSHDETCNNNMNFVFDRENEIRVFESDKNKSGDLAGFADEEEIFNMPILLDSMAEGMLLTPLAMKKGFNWSQLYDDDDDDDAGGGGGAIELNLWVH